MAALLELTEESVRCRVKLKHDNIEDVKSLSLPGNYHEKITSLGISLRKFTRLKSLDLSRNALTSLSGLEHLKLLENLNLYYNSISNLEELKRLRHNYKLVEIDLRLNPVARDEPDYRLYLIHLLPNLQKLDDRGVRDRERQAALIHFTSGQAAEFSAPTPPPTPDVPDRRSHPRVEYLQAQNKQSTVLDDDDVEVLDLIARSKGDLGKPRQITGSVALQDDMAEYSLDDLKHLPDCTLDTRNLPTRTTTASNGHVYSGLTQPISVAMKYPNIPSKPLDGTITSSSSSMRPVESDIQQVGDPNLKYTDEMEGYTKCKGHGFFTPHPGFVESQEVEGTPDPCDLLWPGSTLPAEVPPSAPKPAFHDEGPGDGVVVDKQLDAPEICPSPVQKLQQNSWSPTGSHERHNTGVTCPDSMGSLERDLLTTFLDLVDKYWNGSRSLHKNPKFKKVALDLLERFEKSLSGGRPVKYGECRKLEQGRQPTGNNGQEASCRNTLTSSLNEKQMKASLKQAYEDVEALQSHLQKYVMENKHLQSKIKEADNAVCKDRNSSLSQIDELEKQNRDLREEIEKLRVHLKKLGHVEELASMLQESHKSLVQTNDHLLKELSETRIRHQHEVKQLHWSYDQLKKTMNNLSFSADATAASYVE